MIKKLFAVAMLLAPLSIANTITPQQLVLTNQYGETSMNYVNGTYLPLPTPGLSLLIASGTITPTSTTLRGYAGTGSLYINRNLALYGSAKLFINMGTITTPAWQVVGP